jgi:HSP20 family protein
MELVRWNPMRDLLSIRPRINRLMDDFFIPGHPVSREAFSRDWHPSVDVYDEDDRIVLKAELPGVDKDHIEVDVKDRVLTLKGERTLDNEVQDDNYYRRERSFGKFERRFTLPVNVDAGDIKAEYKDGLLRVDIPKPVAEKPRQITVH